MKLFFFLALASLPFLSIGQTSADQPSETSPDGASRVAVTFTGGYDTDPQDRGRPVILIAAALNVPSEVFRAAFSKVKPAHAGQSPEPDQVRKNKQALMESLGPYGVTDDRLNAVSNHYRYRRDLGEMWPTTPAIAYATIQNGVVTGVTITDPGSGYSSVPMVSIPGWPNLKPTVVLGFSTDFDKNGSVKEIAIK